HPAAMCDLIVVGIVVTGFFDLVRNTIAAGHVSDLFFGSCQPDRMVVKNIDISLQYISGIPMRVDTDKYDTCLIGICAELLHDLRELGHSGGADIRAACIAEEQHHGFAFEVFFAEGFSACTV